MTTIRTILFADICDSSQLYRSLGDVRAQHLVTACLDLLGDCATRHHGELLKTIGDEVMCLFGDVEPAARAAVDMHTRVRRGEGLPAHPSSMRVRIGLHHGPVVVQEQDVFGDAVNLAARMVAAAKGGQVLMAASLAGRLPDALQGGVRGIGPLFVKGQAEPVTACELVWDADDLTELRPHVPPPVAVPVFGLVLELDRQLWSLEPSGIGLLLGRGSHVDVRIEDGRVSREHARIEFRKRHYVLSDHSTNGTFVSTPAGRHFLHNEELVLGERGMISLGRDLAVATAAIGYRLLGPAD